MRVSHWKEHFTQPITGFDPVEAQGLTELGYALIHRQIDEQEYLSWARQNFEMCSVDVNFFQKNSPPLSLVRRLKETYTWGPEILPVAEWDGHLIVLSLTKPEIDIPNELKPIVLLAPVSELSKYWDECLKQLEGASEKTEGEEGASEIGGGLLEGISLEAPTAITDLDFSGIRPLLGEKTAVTQITKSVNIDKLDKKVKPSTPPSIPASAPTEVAIEINTVIKPKSLGPTPNKLQSDLNAAVTAALPKEIPKIPEPPPPLPKAIPSPTTIASESEVIKKAEPQVIGVINPAAAVSEGPVLQALQQIGNLYENRCYVDFQASKQVARAQLWPAEMNITIAPTDMTLKNDSFLKIVGNTQKPYHGHLIKTPVTEQFFKEMNHGAIPENVTLVPIVKNNEVVGALMGWGSKSTYQMSTLREFEKIVQQLCLNLGFTTPDAA